MVTLLAKDDKTGANHRAVNACAFRWQEAARQALVVFSKVGGDINDALRRSAP
jgi:hypothetical protein